jgi:hypothetical protein
MKVHIEGYTLTPTVTVLGCEQSFGCEQLEIVFGKEWKRLKKYVTIYPTRYDDDVIVIEYKNSPIVLPERIYERSGSCRYVVSGENSKKRIVTKTGYFSILKSPEEAPKENEPQHQKIKGGSV